MTENKIKNSPVAYVGDPDALRHWAKQHGFTYEMAAEALGISRIGYAFLLSGKNPIDLRTGLACSAITAGLRPLKKLKGAEPRPRKAKQDLSFYDNISAKDLPLPHDASAWLVNAASSLSSMSLSDALIQVERMTLVLKTAMVQRFGSE